MKKIQTSLKHFLTTSVLSLAFLSSLLAQSSVTPQRPAVKLDVLIDGKQFTISDGDTLQYDSRSIIVRTSKYMTFDFDGLSFDFPKHFSSEFQQDEGYRTWTLDGNDFVIMYFSFDVEVDRDVFVKEMVDKFGKKNCSLSDRRTRLGNIDLAGKRINITLAGVKLTYDIFTLDSIDGKTRLLAFQDTKRDDGSESEEGLATLDVINKTIQLR